MGLNQTKRTLVALLLEAWRVRLPRIDSQPDIFLALTVITVVALLVMPIPTFLIDIFISANISAALIVLLLAIYIPNALKLSSFPSILLIATLFRLGLNVATSRLILLNADAGEMVLAFGNTVVGGNLVVGIVIFLVWPYFSNDLPKMAKSH